MKEVKAVAKNVRSTPRKTRIVARAVRGMKAKNALDNLKYMQKGAAHHVYKVVASAIANAENNEGMNPDKLFISQIFVDDGIVMKRFRPESKGRVRQILKRNCHITVFVAEMGAGEIKQDKPEVKESKPKDSDKKSEVESKDEIKPKKKTIKSKSTTKK